MESWYFGKFIFWNFQISKKPQTPQNTDPHPCTRPSWSRSLSEWSIRLLQKQDYPTNTSFTWPRQRWPRQLGCGSGTANNYWVGKYDWWKLRPEHFRIGRLPESKTCVETHGEWQNRLAGRNRYFRIMSLTINICITLLVRLAMNTVISSKAFLGWLIACPANHRMNCMFL